MKRIALLLLLLPGVSHAATCVFNWNQPLIANPLTYNVYKDGVKFNKEPITLLNWEAPCAAGEYYVTAIDDGGFESEPSEKKTISFPAAPIDFSITLKK